METFTLNSNQAVKLTVKISSDANVGSNVSIDDVILKKSIQYNFTTDLGTDLDQKTVSVVSNFFVSTGNGNAIFNNTNVSYVIKQGDSVKEFSAEKVKLNSSIFMAYIVIKFKK